MCGAKAFVSETAQEELLLERAGMAYKKNGVGVEAHSAFTWRGSRWK